MEELEIATTRHQGMLMLILFGGLDFRTGKWLLARVVVLSKDRPVPRVGLDLSEVNYLDLSGAGLLLTAHDCLRQNGGDLTITRTSDYVAGVLTAVAPALGRLQWSERQLGPRKRPSGLKF